MKFKLLFAVALAGIAAGAYSAYVYSHHPAAQPPAFEPATNPYKDGIYASGIVESYQSHGENINIYPEVSGPITRISVAEGDAVHRGDVLMTIDDSVQRATVEQQRMQVEAAQALLEQLQAQPRPEVLEVAKAQVVWAQASLRSAEDQLTKLQHAYDLSAGAISMQTLDDARNAVRIAEANLAVVQRQFDLTKAGAWIYDVKNQTAQQAALAQGLAASQALLAKYSIRAPADGIVLSIHATAGGYVSPQGTYDTYSASLGPVLVMGTPQDLLQVRCYVDEILVHRLPQPELIKATMFIRGTEIPVPLTFERIQPYVTPKIELSDQRLERVDVRVLPVIFKFEKPKGSNIFPGQLGDVYITQTSTLTH